MRVWENGWSRWLIAFCAALFHSLHVSIVYIGPSVLLGSVCDDFGVSVARAVIPINAFKVSLVLFSPLVGIVTAVVGVRKAFVGAVVGAGLTSLLYHRANTVAQLSVLEVLFALSFTFCGIAVLQEIALSWFDDDIGLATAIVLSGWSISGLLTPVLMAGDIQQHGWRHAYLHYSFYYLMFAIPIALFVLKERNETEFDAPVQTTARSPIDTINTLRTLSSSHIFWCLISIFCTLAFVIGVVQEHLLVYFSAEREMEVHLAGRVYAMIHLTALFAKPAAGFIGDKTDHIKVLCVGSFGATFALVILLVQVRYHSRPSS